MNENKQNFYLFLDFDGVLNDITTANKLSEIGGFFVKTDNEDNFNKHSIEALNYLVDTLETKYAVNLVLSTTWRKNFSKAVNILFNNGLKYKGDIDCTPKFFGKKRNVEIIDYLNRHKVENDYLIIDDLKNIHEHFCERNHIKTNLLNGALCMSDVLNYINKYMPDLYGVVPFEDDLMQIKE